MAPDERGTLQARDEAQGFPANPRPTVGVELEVWLVDRATRDLAPRAGDVLAALGGESEHYKHELFESIVEVTTGVCTTIGDVRRDLGDRLGRLRDAARALGLGTACTGTHPFASYRHMPISNRERYARLVQAMQ